MLACVNYIQHGIFSPCLDESLGMGDFGKSKNKKKHFLFLQSLKEDRNPKKKAFFLIFIFTRKCFICMTFTK